MKWNDVTLRQFLELQKLLEIEDEQDRLVAVAELLLGEEVTDLPLSEFTKKVKELDFLKEEIPETHIVKTVKVNDRKYEIDAVLGHISTAQYIDFINYSKQENKFAEMLSVFFIPKGHKYNDGYDMSQVIEDMYELPIDIVHSESFFFSKQFNKFIQIFQSYSLKSIEETNLPKDVKENLKTVVTNSVNLAFSPSYLSSVK